MYNYPGGAYSKLAKGWSMEDRADRCRAYYYEEITYSIERDPFEFLNDWFMNSDQCTDPEFEITDAVCEQVKLWVQVYQTPMSHPLDAVYGPSFQKWLDHLVEMNIDNWE